MKILPGCVPREGAGRDIPCYKKTFGKYPLCPISVSGPTFYTKWRFSSIRGTLYVCLWLKFLPSLTLSKIKSFPKVFKLDLSILMIDFTFADFGTFLKLTYNLPFRRIAISSHIPIIAAAENRMIPINDMP